MSALFLILPGQRVMPPFTGNTVAPGMGAPVERNARTASRADNNGKHHAKPGTGTIHRF